MPERKPTDSQRRKSLQDLLPQPIEVETSRGQFYVRHIGRREEEALAPLLDGGFTPEQLGKKALQVLIRTTSGFADSAELSDSDLEAFTFEDWVLFAPAIAKRVGIKELPVEGLRTALGVALVPIIKEFRESSRKLWESVQKQYGAFKQPAIDSVLDSLQGIKSFRESLLDRDFIQLHESKPFPYEPFVLPEVPSIDETPIGQAVLGASQDLATVVEIARQTALNISAVQVALVQEVIPDWTAQVQEQQRNAASTLLQARNSLRLAACALFASVAVGWWQVVVTKNLALESAALQQAGDAETVKRHQVEVDLLKEQLATQRAFIEQQREDSRALREVLIALKSQSVAEPAAPKR